MSTPATTADQAAAEHAKPTRDPAVSADGHRPTTTEVVRLGVGFTISAVACAIPWVALSSLILPAVLEGIDPANKEPMLGLINGVGSLVALFANIIFGTFSDLTRSRFGKRTPWIIAGGIITGLAIGSIAFVHSFVPILLLWGLAQLGYNMMLAPYVATMSDRVPDKYRGTVSGFYGAGIAAGQTLGSFVGAQLLKNGAAGIFGGWMMGLAVFGLCGIVVVIIWPRERANVDERREAVTAKSVLLSFRPPRNAPDFYYALAGRTLMMGGYWMINTYQLFIAQDYVFAGDPDSKVKAASVIATMAVITLIVSLIAAVSAGPLTDRLGMRKVPVALASCLFALGALMPLLFPLRDGHVPVRRRRRPWLRHIQRDRPGPERGRAAQPGRSRQGPGHPQPRKHAVHRDRHGDDLADRRDRQGGDGRDADPAGRLLGGVRRRDRDRAARRRAHHAHQACEVTAAARSL